MKRILNTIFLICIVNVAFSLKLNNKTSFKMQDTANLIVNGDFQDSSNGWTGTNGVEVGLGFIYNPNWIIYGDDKIKVTELSVDQPTTISQKINIEGIRKCHITFAVGGRISTNIENNKLSVYWNGNEIYREDLADYEIKEKYFEIRSINGENTVSFEGRGETSLGPTVTNISLICEDIPRNEDDC